MKQKTRAPVSDSVFREVYDSPASLPGRHRWLTNDRNQWGHRAYGAISTAYGAMT